MLKKTTVFWISLLIFFIGITAIFASMALSGFDKVSTAVLICQGVCVLSLLGLLLIKNAAPDSEAAGDEELNEVLYQNDEISNESSDYEEYEIEELNLDLGKKSSSENRFSIDLSNMQEPEENEISLEDDLTAALEDIRAMEPDGEIDPEPAYHAVEEYVPSAEPVEEISAEDKRYMLKIQRLRRVRNYTKDRPKSIKRGILK